MEDYENIETGKVASSLPKRALVGFGLLAVGVMVVFLGSGFRGGSQAMPASVNAVSLNAQVHDSPMTATASQQTHKQAAKPRSCCHDAQCEDGKDCVDWRDGTCSCEAAVPTPASDLTADAATAVSQCSEPLQCSDGKHKFCVPPRGWFGMCSDASDPRDCDCARYRDCQCCKKGLGGVPYDCGASHTETCWGCSAAMARGLGSGACNCRRSGNSCYPDYWTQDCFPHCQEYGGFCGCRC